MFFRAKPVIEIVAPITGVAKRLSEVPDPIFAEKIVGDGVAIVPSGQEVVAPFSCEVVQIAHAQHALAVRNEQGVEFLIHMGIDTVKMKEDVFHYTVQVGDKVQKGDVMLRVDWDRIKDQSYNTISPCLILNYQDMKQTKFYYGDVKAGETKLMEIAR